MAQHRSFTQAAHALGLSRSALSHTVAALERQLGQRLLHRTTRSVAPTEAGERLLAQVGPVLADLNHALDAFGEEHKAVTGTLRINASDTAARVMMRRAVPMFLTLHPRASLELIVDRGFVDIVKQGFDAGVRFAGAVPQDMIAVPFGDPLRFVAVASPEYLAKHGRPQTPNDLQSHRCIRHRMPGGRIYRWEFAKHGQEQAIDVPGALTLNNNETMLDAASSGLGLAYVPEQAAMTMIRDGSLSTILDEWSPPASRLSLYYTGHRHVPAGLRSFIDILVANGQ